MAAIKKTRYPFRLPVHEFQNIHASLEDAFVAHDYLYVARFGRENPEIHGCSLILLGNMVGGEGILDKNDIRTARSCLYRAYGHWRDGNSDEAHRWLAEGRKIGGEESRIARAEALFSRTNFHIVLHSDFASADRLRPFQQVEGVNITLSRMINAQGQSANLEFGESIKARIAAGTHVDLVIVNDLWMLPVGLRDLGATVVVTTNDHERYIEMIDEVRSEIDLLSFHQSSEITDISRPFNIPSTMFPFLIANDIPKLKGLSKEFLTGRQRSWDLVATGGMTPDMYRDKRQRIAPLAKLPRDFKVLIDENRLSNDNYDALLLESKVSITASRATNYYSARMYESLSKGALQLVDEKSGIPFFFSEEFKCFPVYTFDNACRDVESHLHNYDNIIQSFLPQVGRLESEMLSLMPDDDVIRAQRFLRHILFATEVEMKRKTAPVTSARTWVPVNDPMYVLGMPDQVRRIIAHTPSPFWIRKAMLELVLPEASAIQRIYNTVIQGLAEFPTCLSLQYTLALILRIANQVTEADKLFADITNGLFHLRNNESFPSHLDKINGNYWIADAKIRDRKASDLTLTCERAVWQSYAMNQRADLAINRALSANGHEAVSEYTRASILMERSLDMVPHNESSPRIYLRAIFGLWSCGITECAERFLENFRIATTNDYTIFYDFSPMAIHIMSSNGDKTGVQSIADERSLYEQRLKLLPTHYHLYPEVIPLLEMHKIAHVNSQP